MIRHMMSALKTVTYVFQIAPEAGVISVPPLTVGVWTPSAPGEAIRFCKISTRLSIISAVAHAMSHFTDTLISNGQALAARRRFSYRGTTPGLISKKTESSAMNYRTSQHARMRMQQRGIPPHVVDNIITYGSTCKVKGGAVARFMNREAMQYAENTLSKHERLALDRHKRVYVIVESDRVITVGHRRERYYK